MNWLDFVIKSLAVYRVSHMVSREDGPADVFSKFRERFDPNSNAGRGVACPMCLSFYFAFLWALPADNPAAKFVTRALALSGVTVIFTKYLR